MTARVTVRQLQLRAAELLDRVAAGELIGITREGRLIAVLAPPDPEQRVLEGLVRDGTLDPENAATARGVADWTPSSIAVRLPSATEALHGMRDEEGR
ncbi:type II toxin-antitoxin system Phd/YefM family antitoxin [Kitasatospora sp. NPDC059827]|uniref:type II toxin-antitoxin system Phd/YefM family antitoxin n=1 Tax=Kitasatospora sp. NPDC059827 TaxID=3346964 RepID=UPI003660C3D9